MNDKILGMFYGLAIGDALGVPYEFRSFNPKLEYTGLLHQVDGFIQFRFAKILVPKNSPSDDTRMTLALLKGLDSEDEYKYSKKVLEEYLKWANAESMLGKNTRKLLKGVTTIKGYTNRFNKLTDSEKVQMQSNGSLMRISPIVLILDPDECYAAVKEDTYLTNPNKINYDVNIFYVKLLRKIVYEYCSKSELIEWIVKWTREKNDVSKDVKDIVKDAIDRKKKDVSESKGWVLNALYICVFSFISFDNYEDAMDFIIRDNPRSDTDTNAAIAGALFGAYIGLEGLKKESKTAVNIESISYRPEIKNFLQYTGN